eukprot:PhF_6_TR23816/c0_g1_i3/m.33359/K15109/SLC25A20_29, CACT, CACL, CRC1; solute carrier family 25 (mitochondrial carnitine/acylcarnitine transporter), member 20/29
MSESLESSVDFIAGTFAGMTSKLAEFPLDTVKTRLQDSHSKYTGPMDCVKTMFREEGVRGFYQGVGAPLSGAMLETAILFTVYGRMVNWLSQPSGSNKEETTTTLTQYGIAGGTAGFVNSFALTPFELVKCRMQIQDTLPVQQRKYRGAFHAAVTIMRDESCRALFRGLTPTMAREVAGNTAWYVSYEWSRRMLAHFGGYSRVEDLPMSAIAASGAFAGLWDWTILFPADVVATRIRVDAEYAGMSMLEGLKV